jgi:chromate transporter
MGPITLGILFAVGVKILRLSDTNAAGFLVSLVVCALVLQTRLSPLWLMAAAALLGGFGVIHR